MGPSEGVVGPGKTLYLAKHPPDGPGVRPLWHLEETDIMLVNVNEELGHTPNSNQRHLG